MVPPGFSSDTTTEQDSSFDSNRKHHDGSTARSTTQCDHSGSSDWTPLLSLNTQQKLDAGAFDDDPLSDHPDFEPSDGDQEMVSAEEQLETYPGENANEEVMGVGPMDVEADNNNTGANPENPEETRNPVLPSTSTQQLQPTAPRAGTLALPVEAHDGTDTGVFIRR